MKKNDPISSYILISNSHDGGMSVRVGFTPIRVFCANMLTTVQKDEASQIIRVYHTKNLTANLEDIRNLMDVMHNQFVATVETYKELASRKDINSEDLKKYVKQVFSVSKIEKIIEDAEEREKIEIETERKRLLNRVEEIFELEPARTTWNMYNAVNSYLNHERGRNIESRYDSTMFGLNKVIDQRALKLALELY